MHSTTNENLTATLGATINSIDFANLSSITDHAIEKIINLFHTHHLLIIKNQRLTEEQLIQISHLFGEPTKALVPTYRLEKYPVITRHTNTKDENLMPKGVVAPEYVFHSDSYFTCNPSKATLFYCLKAPNQGGETHFVNMCLAYDNLDEETKNFIADKKISYKNAFTNQPPVKHPLVRINPVTKEKALFVNIHRALGIDGIDETESLPLIKRLYQSAILPEFVYKHKWQDGDLLIWNNPTTMHCATPIADSEERLLYRILTNGDLPVS
jgi:taurine dioxygenase